MSIHAPGSNKPLEYLKEQGADQVQVYNSIMEREIKTLVTGGGGVRWYPHPAWFGLTQSAKSFDGSHYMYQVRPLVCCLMRNHEH